MHALIRNFKMGNYRTCQAFLWIILYLTIIDIAINLIFKFPENPDKSPPSFLQGYFEYGRSVEGKFARLASKSGNNQSAPIIGYGWLQNMQYESRPEKADNGQTLIAVYGMSHANLLGEAIAKKDNKYVIRSIAGPGTPPGWSFAMYRADKGHHEASVVILGIMTENVAFLSATSGATSYFDMSHPYTFPRYFLQDGLLKEIYPPFYTEEGFKNYLFDPFKWTEYRNWLARYDKFYSPFLFKESIIDKSALFRVLRRAYSERFKENRISSILTNNGFNMNSEEVMVLHKILETFAKEVRMEKKIPIVYIVNNEGRGDHLYRALQPVLEANKIPYLSTHIICPPDNPRVFLGINSHFTAEKDIELAQEIIKIIEDIKVDNESRHRYE